MSKGEARLADVAKVSLGQTFRGRAEADEPLSGIKLVQIRDVNEGILNSTKSLPYADIDPEKLKIELQPGDLLLPLRGTRFKACVYTPVEIQRTTTTNQVAVIRPSQSIVSIEFLLWFFNSNVGGRALNQIARGTTVASINLADLHNLKLPVPSIEDQQLIVETYKCWLEQKNVLEEMIDNGARLADSLYLKILERSNHAAQ